MATVPTSKVQTKRKKSPKASTQQRIACFLAALPDLNPKFKK
jgi:hypothetical protein